jgi:Tfp pilus assembly protein PilE
MTMIELCVVIGIVTVLMAMVLGISRHVTEIVNIRRAQADLGEWHETLNRWHLQFGEYPYEAVNVETGDILETDLIRESTPSLNLSNVLERCYLRFKTAGGSDTNITLRSFMTADVKLTDPWGSPYIYDCDPGKKSYTLFSCGPDSRSKLNDTPIPSGATSSTIDPTLDDIYFER